MQNLSYLDFAQDELQYMIKAYNAGLRCNPMVSQAQRVTECLFKHLATIKLVNNNPAMQSHNLRVLYEFIENLGIKLDDIRIDVMMLNNFYTHTRYPGKDAFIAQPADIDSAVAAVKRIYSFMLRIF